MEVISEITSVHYAIFAVLGAISAVIIGTIIVKKLKDSKDFEQGRKNEIETMYKKFEFSFKKILERIDDVEEFSRNGEYDKITLEILAIRSIATHQLGHFAYARTLLK